MVGYVSLLKEEGRSPTADEENSAKILWDYMNVDTPKLPEVDLLLCLTNIDTLPAEHSANLYHKGKTKKLMFSGKGGRHIECIQDSRSLSRILADVAIENNVPEEDIILEEESMNTGQNFSYSAAKLKELKIELEKLAVAHMPSSLRRDRLVYEKQWQFPRPEVFMTSPKESLEDYHIRGYQGKKTHEGVINSMLGDFQRMFIHPKLGFSVPVEAVYESTPGNVKDAYLYLVRNEWGGDNLLRDDKTGNPVPI